MILFKFNFSFVAPLNVASSTTVHLFPLHENRTQPLNSLSIYSAICALPGHPSELVYWWSRWRAVFAGFRSAVTDNLLFCCFETAAAENTQWESTNSKDNIRPTIHGEIELGHCGKMVAFRRSNWVEVNLLVLHILLSSCGWWVLFVLIRRNMIAVCSIAWNDHFESGRALLALLRYDAGYQRYFNCSVDFYHEMNFCKHFCLLFIYLERIWKCYWRLWINFREFQGYFLLSVCNVDAWWLFSQSRLWISDQIRAFIESYGLQCHRVMQRDIRKAHSYE